MTEEKNEITVFEGLVIPQILKYLNTSNPQVYSSIRTDTHFLSSTLRLNFCYLKIFTFSSSTLLPKKHGVKLICSIKQAYSEKHAIKEVCY